ncbi:IclR family transcriptional regulator [Marinibacterium profundimaris]|uniref:Transcriptional regulator n=1 Tax=Marinibacterium profundimaris TaxID=1679460 RepID=A0A225NTR8_9RHOB|nr:helix-turn-helix domain-containing protein [Marinibacterium profundimaris]OWU74990.1 transcriptional regulator [Marinibacterium profundimaris]
MTTGRLQTLDRGIETLLLVARTPGGLKVGDLADRLGLHRAVAYRIVATLADHAMVRRMEDGRIVLGAAAYMLGARSSDGVRDQARPVLERLAEQTGATAFLSIAEGDECVVALTAEPREVGVAIHYRVGTRHPLNRGAAGIAILALRPETEGESEDLKFARVHGYSVTRGQLHKGAIGVSSAVRLSTAGEAGLELSVGVVALEELDLDRAAEAVPAAARALSDRLG